MAYKASSYVLECIGSFVGLGGIMDGLPGFRSTGGGYGKQLSGAYIRLTMVKLTTMQIPQDHF